MRDFGLLKIVFLLAALSLLGACGPNEVPGAKNWDVENFSFEDQEGQTFSKSDLKGKIWVADFIFTNCEDVCLPMTSNMSKLQMALKEEGMENVEFVSFSVDPEVDRPEVLKAFAGQFKADLSNWHFLTGYDQQTIESFAMNNFKTIVQKPEKEDQVIHGTDIYLVDQEGKIIQTYSGLSDFPLQEIVKHIKILENY
ncbi:SCO family protein [Bacillus massiliglaciei]|uniref:SCO family protein n=1 Tax=Bacillus massiliglaciei TaxID=1816693 RepID=UPI000A97BD65|nr:SCO family protein [Bacillus massiliglaciei]